MSKYEIKHITNNTSDGKVYGTNTTTTLYNIEKVEKDKGLIKFIDSDGNENTFLEISILSYKEIKE